MNRTAHVGSSRLRRAALLAAGLVASIALAACGGSTTQPTPTVAVSTSTATADPTATMRQDAGGSQVLPVSTNPIANTSTVQVLTIDSVLVENNVDASGKAVDDHLEIALTNTGSAELTGFEVYYTFSDPATSTTESYYAELPASLVIPAGGTRDVHFDNTGEADHVPVNAFSLYSTDANALDVTVVVSATDATVQTATVQKDAGGAEEAD